MSRIRKSRFGLLFVLLLVAAGAVAWWAWQRYTAFADAPLAGLEQGDSIVVERGDSFPVVIGKLREAGVREGEAAEWRLLARQLGAASSLHVGEYALVPGTTPRELLVAMREGDTIQHRFTIVEGWNIRELRAALAAADPLEHESADLDNDALMAALGHPDQHPEGRFLPETYLYTRGDSDLDLLRRAHAASARALAAAWEDRDPDTQLKSPYEMLILASIVEKETGIAAERPQIAGLFERRLKIGMRLQTDPTVIYGIGEDYDGNIRRSHLTTDTPYNTYTRAGLPPTPIAMPGVDALQAVANPADGSALYFVAIGDGSGRHLFADTLAEHQANVRKYLRNYRQNTRDAQ
ncbi:aminodeoxychorismate lyase [Lysobacter arseniciresistens ZS79]|uniref:Endolytic murein transglycosylase n=1 Tax=Lysobacter arseniciresistens ZS79 TaxID=913325 RepID=A0A0A0F829_9GAMM|nr:endolytic transglycosylase MltG [Lysobacter arseniciresistens]KGM57527.1 aminodeoxychorismate lyase [Lysobacter arseniciresistens ZS79]